MRIPLSWLNELLSQPVPPETDEQPMSGDPGDDSDAPIRLDELAPDEADA